MEKTLNTSSNSIIRRLVEQADFSVKQDYIVFSISLEGIGEAIYRDEFTFCRELFRLMDAAVKYGETEGLTISDIAVFVGRGNKK